MNIFLKHLSEQYPEYRIVLCCDGASWRKSKALQVPENIRLFFIPPYTPEMNPIEQIWKELRKFGNEIFATLEKFIDRLRDVINGLSAVSLGTAGCCLALIRNSYYSLAVFKKENFLFDM